jgi:hypothetical protein
MVIPTVARYEAKIRCYNLLIRKEKEREKEEKERRREVPRAHTSPIAPSIPF